MAKIYILFIGPQGATGGGGGERGRAECLIQRSSVKESRDLTNHTVEVYIIVWFVIVVWLHFILKGSIKSVSVNLYKYSQKSTNVAPLGGARRNITVPIFVPVQPGVQMLWHPHTTSKSYKSLDHIAHRHSNQQFLGFKKIKYENCRQLVQTKPTKGEKNTTKTRRGSTVKKVNFIVVFTWFKCTVRAWKGKDRILYGRHSQRDDSNHCVHTRAAVRNRRQTFHHDQRVLLTKGRCKIVLILGRCAVTAGMKALTFVSICLSLVCDYCAKTAPSPRWVTFKYFHSFHKDSKSHLRKRRVEEKSSEYFLKMHLHRDCVHWGRAGKYMLEVPAISPLYFSMVAMIWIIESQRKHYLQQKHVNHWHSFIWWALRFTVWNRTADESSV